eukprot:TRINITY_DN4082_c0_g1_i1.p1 TRINITY_DN4082_c0_g1~~TRINITY_DN4082_c0_g1_i1.p1  ORF type:complete len:461 (-),score=154.50 TRINITY_DN4082_c0_g1_i1:91-1473(-)
MQQCWLSLRDETEVLATDRQQFADKLEELVNKITTKLKEDKRERALLVAKGKKLESDLNNTEDVTKKARAKYVEARKKQDKSQEAYTQLKAKTPASSNLAKLQKSAEKDEKKADKADNEYRIEVKNLKVAQDKFYEQDMPNLLRDFEKFENNRLDNTKEYFLEIVNHQLPLGPAISQSTERYQAKVKQVNVKADLSLYVKNNPPSAPQPPARAQYISYDGSVIQDVNTSSSTPVPIATSTTTTTTTTAASTPPSNSTTPVTSPEKKPSKKDKTPKKKKEGKSKTSAEPTTNGASTPPDNGESTSAKAAPSGEQNGPAGEEPNNEPAAGDNVADEIIELITIYEYVATEDNELSFGEGEVIILLEKDESGWWRGRNSKGEEGVFPSNFVEPKGQSSTSGTVEINADFVALYDYDAEDPTELTIKEGEVLHVLNETDGWYYGSNKEGVLGSFPSNFVEKVDS